MYGYRRREITREIGGPLYTGFFFPLKSVTLTEVVGSRVLWFGRTAQWMRWLGVSPLRPLSSLLYIHIMVRASVAKMLVMWANMGFQVGF